MFFGFLFLSVTGRTTRDHFRTSDPVLRFEIGPFLRRKITVLPLHIVDLGLWPYKFFGRAVTFQTPFHLQSILLKDRGHVIDLAMTRRTSDALRHVYAVIKIGEFRKVVHAFPFDRFVVTKTRPDRFKIWTVRPDLAVAVHTRLCRRHSGGRGRLDRRMAVSAVYTVVADVMFMAELNGLLPFHIPTGEI